MKIERRFVVFAIAISCGILASLLAYVYIKRTIGEKEAQIRGFLGEAAVVLEATRDIPRGSQIKENMVGLKKVPSNFAQPYVLTSIEAAIDKIAAADIAKGEQILRNKITTKQLTNEETVSSLSNKTPAGKRAITIPIDALSAVGGMISTGDYVDIIGDFPTTVQVQGKPLTTMITVTLFQNVLVLEVGGPQGSRTKGPTVNTVTLALSPQEATFLNYAQQQGKIRLLLRPPLETQTQILPPISIDTFWAEIYRKAGITMQPPAEIESPVTPSNVEIYRGHKKEDVPLKKE